MTKARVLAWVGALGVAACSSPGHSLAAKPSVDASLPPEDSGGPCGAEGQPCCPESICNAALACNAASLCVPGNLPGDAGPDGCGAFVACGGTCKDTMSDAANCGACGHSCGDAECTMGICSPTVLAMGINNAVRIALDDTNVYWTAAGDGTVSVIPKQGGTVGVLASNIPSPWGIAVNATTVYFTSEGTAAGSYEDGAILEVPVGKGSATGTKPTVLAKNRRRPRTLKLDAVNAYWLDHGIGAADGTLALCALSGCVAAGPTPVQTALQSPYGLAVWSSTLFYSLVGAGVVLSVPIAGGVPTSVSSGQQAPSGVAVDGSAVFWASIDGGNVSSAPLSGGEGSSTVLAQVQGFPQDVVTDGTSVYFTDTQTVPGEGAVMRCPVAGCTGAPLVLAADTPTALDVAVDETFVYWLGSDGSLMRAAK